MSFSIARFPRNSSNICFLVATIVALLSAFSCLWYWFIVLSFVDVGELLTVEDDVALPHQVTPYLYGCQAFIFTKSEIS